MSDALFLLAGLAVLTFSADRFVEGAAGVSTLMNVPIVVVGAVVIGFGTSAPELLVSALASIDGRQDIAIGNIVGSNMANLTLVAGAAAAFATLPITLRIWQREIRLMLLAVGLLALVSIDLRIEAWEAVVLLVAAVLAIGQIMRWAAQDRAQGQDDLSDEVAEYVQDLTLRRAWTLTGLGLLGTLGGAQMLVTGAAGLAATLGVPEAVIGLTIVAVGTSLPELVTAVAAARKDERDLIVGNVVGSNIFNSLPVAGVAGLLDTTPLDGKLTLSLGLMVGVCVLFAIFARRGFQIERTEGLVLLGAFVAATVLTF
ncbi:calcium/sodium antiporter [Euzebya rosea]|uniref:calcium/sodium antiporter n=1 Tax=Euzebya rosea TaxID=2052804 RepID=UPI0013006BB0|nr:calcium/sodium antiporter [Euzebya rosea]